jgi:hypothetical protein
MNIRSGLSAGIINGNIAKQLLSLVFIMKKYLLKLIEEDISHTKHFLLNWIRMDEKFQTSEYQIKRKLAMERKLEKIIRYKTRLENE